MSRVWWSALAVGWAAGGVFAAGLAVTGVASSPTTVAASFVLSFLASLCTGWSLRVHHWWN